MVSQNQTNYYAIIPASVRYCKNLIPNAKLLYGEITALSNQEGYCWAGNRYFQDLYEVDETTIQRWLKSLKDLGFIHVEIEKKGMITKRKIWITEAFQKINTTPQKRGGRHGEKEVVDTAKTPPIIIQCSNSTKKQQQEPIGSKVCDAAVAFYKCIEEIGLTEREKKGLMKYSEGEVKEAVAFATHESTKIRTTLIKTIMWALKEKPYIPPIIDREKNREEAEACEYLLQSKTWILEALSEKITIHSKNPNNTKVYEIWYDDVRFKENLDKLLKECGFRTCITRS